MSTSGLTARRNCVSRVGTASSVPILSNVETLDLGEFSTGSVETLLSRFQTGITTSAADNEPITAIIRNYGEDPFYASVAAVNMYFMRPDVRKIITPEEYPLLSDRLVSSTPFTPIEIAEFITEFGYSPTSIIVETSIISTKLPFEYESFYTRNFTSSTMGSFCALLPNIFGAVGLFFSVLDGVQDIANKLKNFSLSFSLRSLLMSLKENIVSVIDKVVQKVKNIIENFSISNVMTEIGTFINQTILKKFYELKESVLRFFDPENIKNFKKKIEALIDYATSIFKNPTLEEIQYLLFRFCRFITVVENSINALKNPIENFVNTYKQTLDILRSNSSRNTARSVSAGAIRYSLPARTEGINNTRQIFEMGGNAPFPTDEDYKSITPWNEGNGDSRVAFSGNWTRPPAPSGLPQDGGVGVDGWERVDVEVRVNLMRIQKDFGKRLIVTSGYRPELYNDALNGSAKKTSLHINGLALDITWEGFSVNSQDVNEFIRISRYYGFTHIGKYGPNSGNFIHIGVGRNGYWERA